MLRNKLTAKSLEGVTTALITPFARARTGTVVNLDKFRDLVNLANKAQISGILALGTTAESPALTSEEKSSLIRTAVDTADKNLFVIAGAGSYNTDTTVDSIKSAVELGVDGVLIVTPYYNKPTPAGLKQHFKTVADASGVPVILYHIPGRCGVGIPLDLVLELAEHENIIGIKEAGGDIWRSGEIARQAPDNFAVISGDDPLTLPLMSVGVTGVISVLSNLAPCQMKKMVAYALAGDLKNSLAMHQRLAPLFKALSLETNPGPIKEAMNLAGLKVGTVRPPLANVTTQTRKAISKALKEIGEID